MSDANDHPPTQDRRAFLTTLGGAALAAGGMGIFGCATSPARASGSTPGSTASTQTGSTGGTLVAPIGVQLYSVRDEMQRDMSATLAQVARIGYKEVEFAGYFGRSPEEVRAMLAQYGLSSPSAHIPLDAMRADPAAVAASAKTIGHEYVVVPYLPEEARRTLADWHGIARTLNDLGGQMSRAGLKLAYHSHDFEFAPIEGTVPYDILVGETDPALVKLEIDLYWATKAGQDPVAWFARQPGRFPLVHVKDSRGAPNNEMAPVGSGTIDWKRIFAHRAEAGIQHYIVEHDTAAQYPGGAFASIAASYNYLSTLRV